MNQTHIPSREIEALSLPSFWLESLFSFCIFSCIHVLLSLVLTQPADSNPLPRRTWAVLAFLLDFHELDICRTKQLACKRLSHLRSCYVSFSFKSPSKLCSKTFQRVTDGVIRPKPRQLLGMFDFPEEFPKVKAWYDDVVSRTGRRNTYW